MRFSILIPTYNRKNKLKVVLEAVSKQVGISQGNVIVGVDGSEDGTVEFLKELKLQYPTQLEFFSIPNSGRAIIRNRLIEKATGDVLIFIQDDIVVTEKWLEAHLNFHEQKEGALVGHMTWYPKQEISEYMKWLENGGHMLDFSSYRDGDQMDFWHFYMGNISLQRAHLDSLRFDEEMKVYGWEDIMMGLEFCRKGRKVYYSSFALAYHWDEYCEKDLQDYMAQVGESAVMAEKKYPGTGFVPSPLKKVVFSLMIGFGNVFWFLLPQSAKWYLDMKKWFLQSVSASSQ
ncbi:MAG: glycosyltransferase family A protein [Candidatus Gracilibacteria bacterium]|nr:glycosyltransferase family A protein [Candidatus Gracilibacteria bacterium]